jgi:hypothetical protein
VKEAQDLAIQFVRQINANRRPGERVRAFFVCDTPQDRGVREALLDWPDIEFAWFDYTNPDAASAIRRAIDQGVGLKRLVPNLGAAAPEFARQLEVSLNKRLDDLDRQRTAELKDLYQRLADAESTSARDKVAQGWAAGATGGGLAESGRTSRTEGSALAGESGMPSPALPTEPATPVGFSAAELLAKPDLGLRLRVLMSSTVSWVELIFLVLGLFLAGMSHWLPELWLGTYVKPEFFADSSAREAYEAYLARSAAHSFILLIGGSMVVGLMAILLVREYLAVDSYFDYAKHLINEEYLIAPHHWWLAGANRIARQLPLVYGPRVAAEKLQMEIEGLAGRRSQNSAKAGSSPNGLT